MIEKRQNDKLFTPRRKENVFAHTDHGKPTKPPERKDPVDKERQTNHNVPQGKKRNATKDRNLERPPTKSTTRPPPTRRQRLTHRGQTRTGKGQQYSKSRNGGGR